MNRIALLATLGVAAVAANAQPGTRNAIVYGARAPGETAWHFGSFSRTVAQNQPVTFEVGIFTFRAQGVGFARGVLKTYIDGVVNDGVTDAAEIIEDPSNGYSELGVDGRVSVYNQSLQAQFVFSNRGGDVGGSGYRIASTTDSVDSATTGGIDIRQGVPISNPAFHQGDGELGFRFDLTVADLSAGPRDFTVTTPTSRLKEFSTFDALGSAAKTDFTATAAIDGLTLTATWIPAPSSLVVLGASGLVARRRR